MLKKKHQMKIPGVTYFVIDLIYHFVVSFQLIEIDLEVRG